MGCTACNDKGVVPDAEGNSRPCSRCRTDEFSKWYSDRLAKEGPAVPMKETS